jgi:hypothetical protein
MFPSAAKITGLTFMLTTSFVWAQTAPHDPNLPAARPDALRTMSDNVVRQRILIESQDRFRGRCVCSYTTQDANGRSCKGRHETVASEPKPICYPTEVTDEMVATWRARHPASP